jgi:hypothetical protein
MADNINEQVAEHILEILRLMLDVKGKTLRELNERVGQTSKFELQSTVASEIGFRPKHLRF